MGMGEEVTAQGRFTEAIRIIIDTIKRVDKKREVMSMQSRGGYQDIEILRFYLLINANDGTPDEKEGTMVAKALRRALKKLNIGTIIKGGPTNTNTFSSDNKLIWELLKVEDRFEIRLVMTDIDYLVVDVAVKMSIFNKKRRELTDMLTGMGIECNV